MAWMSHQPCRFYIIDGSCKYGSGCLFSHGLDLFGRIEMQIRALLHEPDVYQVPVEHLPWSRHELGILLRQVGWDETLDHLMSLLECLHTICVVYNSYGYYAILLENVSRYLGYLPYNPNVMDADSEVHQIYINFSAQSREICTEENVRIYFSHYGEVLSVYIPRERSYGFVRFQYPETVRLLLSNWNHLVPHFIFGAGLYVSPYISNNRRNPAENHGPNGLDGGPGHVPNALGGVPGQEPGAPDGNAAQQDMFRKR
ncbi:putative zinc finger CCCH domain-containing protein 51 [Triticum aestivum]|uniref:putative zinc finger CCCH domain-containing protein 51 n=1 Tax=Triticum aestivum TaxID=4565 RepID=UPI001D0030E0|nr:putative zinc finger CCCH domain-containing protein 51 [Triticum aestivum]